jgi:hypothetical protein
MKSTKTVQSYKNTAAQKTEPRLKLVSLVLPILLLIRNKIQDKPVDGVGIEWDFRCLSMTSALVTLWKLEHITV